MWTRKREKNIQVEVNEGMVSQEKRNKEKDREREGMEQTKEEVIILQKAIINRKKTKTQRGGGVGTMESSKEGMKKDKDN